MTELGRLTTPANTEIEASQIQSSNLYNASIFYLTPNTVQRAFTYIVYQVLFTMQQKPAPTTKLHLTMMRKRHVALER